MVLVGSAGVLLLGLVSAEPPSTAVVPVVPIAATPRPLRIMPLGASSTVGTKSPETGGYRGPLELMLAADHIAYDMVGSQQQGPSWMPDRDHEGHAGATIPALLPAVAGWIRATHPDVVLLHVGTNDLLRDVSGAETAARLETMVDTIWAAEDTGPDPYLVVAGVWAPMTGRTAAKTEFTARAAALCARLRAEGRPITFVDTSALLPAGDVADGLHANRAGYELVAKVWEREIERYLSLRH